MHRSRTRGLAALYMIVLMTVFCAMVSLGVDYGRVQLVKTELRRAADAAARAGASGLAHGTTECQRRAVALAAANNVDGKPLLLIPATDIEYGIWAPANLDDDDGDDWDLDPKWEDDDVEDTDEPFKFYPLTASQAGSANAVRVTARLSSERGNAVPLLFAKVLGQATCDVHASATAIVFTGRPGDGIVGLKKLEFKKDSGTDSFDPRFGSYSALLARGNGDIKSNGKIKLKDDVTIHGDAQSWLSNKKNAVQVGKDSTVTGSTSPLAEPLSYAPVDLGSHKSDNDNANVPGQFLRDDGKLEIKDKSQATLPSGTYYLKELKVGKNATLTVNGPTTIYVEKEFSVEGSVLLSSNRAADFRVRLLKKAKVKLKGDGKIYADIYGPGSKVKIDHGIELFGAVISKQLKVGDGSVIHYDESLHSTSRDETVRLVE